MKSVTLRLNEDFGKAIMEIMEDQGQKTGSGAVAIAVKSFLHNQQTIKDQWAEIEELKHDVQEFEACVKLLR